MVAIEKRILIVDDDAGVSASVAPREPKKRQTKETAEAAMGRLKGPVLLALAPFIGLAYVILMPFIGFAVFFAVLGTGLAETLGWARE